MTAVLGSTSAQMKALVIKPVIVLVIHHSVGVYLVRTVLASVQGLQFVKRLVQEHKSDDGGDANTLDMVSKYSTF